MGQWPRSLSGRDDDDGAQISFGDDHRWPGVARERLLSRFFFFSLLYFLRCRHRSGGNENLIGGVFVHSRIVLHHFVIANAKERKRRNMRDGQRGQAWTVWTYQPPIDMCCAQWETFSGPVRSVAIFVRCTPRVMGKPGKPDIGHERNWTSFDKGSSRRVENITTREPSCM